MNAFPSKSYIKGTESKKLKYITKMQIVFQFLIAF